MSNAISKDSILGYECRFAVYCPPPEGDNVDIHYAKEIIHFKDGTTKAHLRPWKNFKRPFWVTKKGLQVHQDKKEWEHKDNLLQFETTEFDKTRNISRALGMNWITDSRKLFRSPYLYGADILSTAVLKKTYQDKYPDLITPFTVAPFDVETDVKNGTNEIIMGTLSFGKNVVTVVKKSFLEGHSNVQDRLQALLVKYLGTYVEKRQINWEVVLVDTEAEIVVECFKRAHLWKPDFIAIWNIDFDMKKMLAALERAGIDPKDVFSDPSVPSRYRHFKFKEGPAQKVTASGKVTPIPPQARWHTVYCPASFYFIDAMCAYKHTRMGAQEEPNYKLDSMLDKHLKVRKLNFEEAEGLSGIDWHMFMQDKYPLEYVIYNVFDCVSMEELDEVTNDLRFTLPLNSGPSDFANFKSQPRRAADTLHYFCLANDHVIGTTSDEMATDMDKETIGVDGWITTLPAHLVADNGLQIIAENPHQRTNIRAHVGDLDVAASYPNGGCVFNISKATTVKELCKIQGVSETMQRQQGINLSAAHTNAVEICQGLYGLPSLETMLDSFQASLKQEENTF